MARVLLFFERYRFKPVSGQTLFEYYTKDRKIVQQNDYVAVIYLSDLSFEILKTRREKIEFSIGLKRIGYLVKEKKLLCKYLGILEDGFDEMEGMIRYEVNLLINSIEEKYSLQDLFRTYHDNNQNIHRYI